MNEKFRKGLHEFLTGLHKGGIAGIANDLKITRQTVYAWEKAGQIPDWHAPALIRFCQDDATVERLSGWTSSSARNNLDKRVARAEAVAAKEKKAGEAKPVVQTFGFNRDGIGEIQAHLKPVPDELDEPEDFPEQESTSSVMLEGESVGQFSSPQPLKPEHQPRRW